MTTDPASKKTHNLLANPRVSLLVHDWISHRPPTRPREPERSGSPPAQATSSSLAAMLLNLNTSAMSRISATINGEARIVESNSEEESWCKDIHLRNNTFGEADSESAALLGTSPTFSATPGDGGRGTFIEGEEVQVVIVKIRDGRVADWKGAVRDWVLSDATPVADSRPLVNGDL